MESKSSILSLTLGDHQRCYVAMAAVPHMNLLRPISISATNARLYLVICHRWPAVPPACQLLSLTNALREFYFLDMPGNGARRLGVWKGAVKGEDEAGKAMIGARLNAQYSKVDGNTTHASLLIGGCSWWSKMFLACGGFCGMNFAKFQCRPISASPQSFSKYGMIVYKIEANTN